MALPDTFWLTATNILLGATVVLCILAVTACVTYDVISRAHKRHTASAELDRDMRRWFGGAGLPVVHHSGVVSWWHRHH